MFRLSRIRLAEYSERERGSFQVLRPNLQTLQLFYLIFQHDAITTDVSLGNLDSENVDIDVDKYASSLINEIGQLEIEKESPKLHAVNASVKTLFST